MATWLNDDRGNRCSVEYFGSREAAQKALDSLKNCDNCTNCSDCSYCSYCSDCSDCSRCSYCSDCSGCSRCSDCSRCSYCSDCSGCSYCSDCSGCSDCSYCSYCSDCSDCSRCSYCSRCSGCSRCSDCSDCSGCSRCSGKVENEGAFKFPPVPKIENIHQTVYEAASQPGALDMGSWHCGTTHCRAGWVVTLAGEAGKAIEAAWTTNHAAWLIYKASDPEIKGRPDLFCSNEEALADMKRLAEAEAA